MGALKTEGFVVTAPLVLLDPNENSAVAEERELYQGAEVPLSRVSQAWLDRMVEGGFIRPRFVFDAT